MNMDGIVGRMNEERARAEQRREKLAVKLRAVEERIERIDVAMAEIEKTSRPRRGRRPGTRAAAAPAPTNGRMRSAGGRVSAKDAMFRTLERIGKDGGVKAEGPARDRRKDVQAGHHRQGGQQRAERPEARGEDPPRGLFLASRRRADLG